MDFSQIGHVNARHVSNVNSSNKDYRQVMTKTMESNKNKRQMSNPHVFKANPQQFASTHKDLIWP
jgi:hypothetical protein